MSKKINWILILQGWTMLWVVIGHAPIDMSQMSGYSKVLFQIAYSFHMPLFFMISGYLFYMTRLSKYPSELWNYKAIMVDKLKRLGIPFVIFTIIAMALKTLFSNYVGRPSEISIEEFVKAILYPTEGPLMELWFVAVLFWMFALTPIWAWAMKYNNISIIIGVILLSVSFIPYHGFSFLCISKVLLNAIWFYLGMLLCHKNCVSVLVRYKTLFLFLGTFLWGGGFIIGVDLLKILGGITFSTSLAVIIDNLYPRLFHSFRDYTYQIFLVGIFAQILVKMVSKKLGMPYFCGYMLNILCGIYIPVIVSQVLLRINYKPLLIAVGLKKY